MIDQTKNRFVARILQLYQRLPHTPNRFNESDYHLAERLFDQGIPAKAVETALVLASVRRLYRNNRLPLLNQIRSLNYFVPIIAEVIEKDLPKDYLNYLQTKLKHYLKKN